MTPQPDPATAPAADSTPTAAPAADDAKPDAKPDAPRRAAGLVFDDPMDRRSADEAGHGWGDRPAPSAGGAADLARFLDEKPPHHV